MLITQSGGYKCYKYCVLNCHTTVYIWSWGSQDMFISTNSFLQWYRKAHRWQDHIHEKYCVDVYNIYYLGNISIAGNSHIGMELFVEIACKLYSTALLQQTLGIKFMSVQCYWLLCHAWVCMPHLAGLFRCWLVTYTVTWSHTYNGVTV